MTETKRVTTTPIGPITLVSDGTALRRVTFGQVDCSGDAEACPILDLAAEELRAYFEGRLSQFTVPLSPRGTSFQQSVWALLSQIPFGATISYTHLAYRLGQPKAVRAVAAANGANPLPLFIPCHRVISADGRVHGYIGGPERKEWLLRHEGVLI